MLVSNKKYLAVNIISAMFDLNVFAIYLTELVSGLYSLVSGVSDHCTGVSGPPSTAQCSVV